MIKLFDKLFRIRRKRPSALFMMDKFSNIAYDGMESRDLGNLVITDRKFDYEYVVQKGMEDLKQFYE